MWGRNSHAINLYKSIIQSYARIRIPITAQRPFSSEAAALADAEPQDPKALDVGVDEYPKPDPKHQVTIRAIPREATKRHAAKRLRKGGWIPSIVFECENGEKGGNKRLISVETKQIRNLLRKLGESFLLSRTFDLEVKAAVDSEEVVEKGRVLPRLIHINRATDEIVNVTFIRAPSHAKLKVQVPLLYRGEDACTGIRRGGYLNTIRRTVKYLCPADHIPPYIDVDLSDLDLGQKILMRDLKVHPSLKLLLRDETWPVCKIMGSRRE
uniref:Uncharacterized protein n=1 Tax=Araucaria cunninghamii TaxID=56994 RepID=A0A0D6R688_ARACU